MNILQTAQRTIAAGNQDAPEATVERGRMAESAFYAFLAPRLE